MNERYAKPKISKIWSDSYKLNLWMETELALIQAYVNLGKTPQKVYDIISTIWRNNPIDIDWWKERDIEIHHDLNAFLDERLRILGSQIHPHVHKKITSFDTEEPAFARMLLDSLKVVFAELKKTDIILRDMSLEYRYTIMNGRTHGQEAELQTFGKRCLTWKKDLWGDTELLEKSKLFTWQKL